MTAARELVVPGARVLTDIGADPARKDILVKGNKIAAITAPDGPVPPGAAVVDGRGKLVIPGLVNAHYHSHDVLSRGMFEDIPLEVWIALAILPPNRVLTPREVRLRTLLGAIDCLRNGITTVQDMLGCGPGSEPQVEAAIEAYEEVGIRCVLGLQVGNRPAIDCLPGIREELPADLVPLLSGNPPETRCFLEFVAAPLARQTHEQLTYAIAPGSPQRCSLELMSGLADLSAKHGLPLVTHVNESKLQIYLAEELYAAYGGSVLDYLEITGAFSTRLCMAHGIWFSDAEIERIAAVGAAIATCPASNLKLKNGIAPLRKLKHAGVRLALGADNTSAGDSQNLFEAMKLVCHLNAGKGSGASTVLATDAFKFATSGGAEVLGLADKVGIIKEGMLADLTILDLHDPSYLPLNDAVRQIVYCESGRAVHTVIVNGAIVVEDHTLKTVDFAPVVEEAAELAEAYQHDNKAHWARLAPVVPYIRRCVRAHAERDLEFDRWPNASDALFTDSGCF
jgi:5-methylthioadenosine/S-adenosylhomocysteine deaminase